MFALPLRGHHPGTAPNHEVRTPDGKIVSTGGSDNTAPLWNAIPSNALAILKYQGSITDMSLQPGRHGGVVLALQAGWRGSEGTEQ